MSLIFGICAFLIACGFILPFVNEEFGQEVTDNNPTGLLDGIDKDDAKSSVGAFNVIGSIFGMFFWTFGGVPIWLDVLLFLPIRILLALIIARNIWIGGGG